MSFGFPNSNNFDPHDINEESFWPSFADIMMVIVMVFLLVAVSVILNNYQLLENLKTSMKAQQLASSIAEDTQIENSTLEERVLKLKQQLALSNAQISDLKKNSEKTKLELQKNQQIIEELNAISSQQTKQLEEKTTFFATLEQESKQKIKQKEEEIKQLKQRQQNQKDELQRTKEKLNTQQQQYEQNQTKSIDLSAQIKALRNSLTDSSSEYRELKQDLSQKTAEIETLKKQRQQDETQLASLQGELNTLDKKYQKLLRPARSSKNKFIVYVMYTKYKGRNVYRIRTNPKGKYKTVSRPELERRMSAFKKKHKSDLYVKIIIPKNSQMSYNDALQFTSSMQKSYDYYFQEEKLEKTGKTKE